MMVKGSERRHADHPIHTQFLDRWSPRAFSGDAVSETELFTLFEAARWAPSAGNGQPWRILYARRDTPQWPVFFDFLYDGNKVWATRAAALLVVLSDSMMDGKEGKPPRANETHAFDAGAAWMSLALQGSLMDLGVHGMAGFDHEAVRAALGVPSRFHVNAMVAVGRPGSPELLPEPVRQREAPNDRRPVAQSVREGKFDF
jgi:nitroreductase